ncbi:CAP domain-containing protein, partial [Streptomyces sp. NPDC059708]|uniref:CAP domain-containing protein n=1 Tax=Streptomyces sp. NPDC059708 TaxID=3346916 RepID=UPI0036A80DB0
MAAALLCGLVMTGSTQTAFAYTPATVAKSALCPTANPPPGTGSQITAADRDALVAAHNDARRAAVKQYNPGLALTSVTWSPKLACDAQAWADDPGSSPGGVLTHSQPADRNNEGENLLNSAPSPARPMKAFDPSVTYSWIAEKPKFDQDDGGKGNPVVDNANYKIWGHYSQIIWMSPQSPTTEIGCGVTEGVPVKDKATGTVNTGWILVCRYAAGGNVTGQRAIPPGSVNPVPPPVPPKPPAPTTAFRGTSAVSQRDGHLDVFWVGPNGAVRSQWWDAGSGGAWAAHPSFDIAAPGSAVPSSAVAAVSQRNNHLDVFWIGPDGSVRSQWWDAGSGGAWAAHPSFSITPPGAAALGSGVAAVAQRNNHLDVFWVGPDGSVRSQWWDAGSGGAWAAHPSFSITAPGSAVPSSAVAAVSQRNNHLDVFWVGP